LTLATRHARRVLEQRQVHESRDERKDLVGVAADQDRDQLVQLAGSIGVVVAFVDAGEVAQQIDERVIGQPATDGERASAQPGERAGFVGGPELGEQARLADAGGSPTTKASPPCPAAR
jgi:hypothetical protein